jgi:5-formyltetrahydrofolate cyclo-ligase
MNPTKTGLRRQLRQARLALSPEERQAKSTAISSRLWQAVDWSTVQSLHCYEPIERLGEVDISDFIEALHDEYPVVQLFTSRQSNSQTDKAWRIVSLTDGKPFLSRPRLPEPQLRGVSGPRLRDQSESPFLPQFDIILVPMLGFDPKTLHRIGYGGGYYDRFLATQSRVQKIGLCFDMGKLDLLSVEPHDIPLDVIITESATILI